MDDTLDVLVTVATPDLSNPEHWQFLKYNNFLMLRPEIKGIRYLDFVNINFLNKS